MPAIVFAFVVLLDKVVVVKPIFLICLSLTILGCAASNGVDYRNFAIDTYSPAANEIQLAEGRARGDDLPVSLRATKMSALTLLRRVGKFFLSPNMLRSLREFQKNWYVSHCPDRAVLIGQIFPAISKPGTTMLWVGCRRYTRRYPSMIEQQGAVCWTLEIDPMARRWGHPERHTVGDLQKVGALYPRGHFDVALVNGVFGWGLDTLDGQNEAVEGLARILKPGGMLMLGWNTNRSSDPTKLPAIEQFFVPSRRPGFERRITFPEVTHVYDFFSRRNSEN